MDDLFDLDAQQRRLDQRHRPRSSHPTLPTPAALLAAEASLPNPLSPDYLTSHSQSDVARHISQDLVPALTGHARSSRYLGFVTGGVLPLAEWADNVVSRTDQNVQVHLPAQSVATAVEHAALEMLLGLLRLDGTAWAGRTLTTGATAANVLGLACAREALLNNVGEVGLLAACRAAGVREVQVLTSAAHSSLYKAASVVGLGRACVRELACGGGRPWKLDLDAVEEALRTEGTASVVAVSGGEVNTGRYALDDVWEWRRLREMADRHGAWIHLDGAFGIFGRALDHRDEYSLLHTRTEGFHLADSIALDGHKLLNVPYDCGVFLTRGGASLLRSVFQNPNAAYLSSPGPTPSPLDTGIENSRRFRALPLYAVLLSEGRPGFAALFHRMAQLARRLAAFLRGSPHYELLPDGGGDDPREIFVVVLFRARDARLNEQLVERINATRRVYVSGTTWKGEKAARMAVSSWRVDVDEDAAAVTDVLDQIALDMS